MLKNKIRWPLLVSGILLGGALLASPRSAKEDYHALAIEPPPQKEAAYSEGQDEGDEIDREIEAYFSKLSNRSHLDVDRQKVKQLFGRSRPGQATNTSFRNYSSTYAARSGEFPSAGEAAEETDNLQSHTVARGDSVQKISRRYRIPPEDVIQHNPDLSTRLLYIGEELMIVREPRAAAGVEEKTRYYTVRRGDYMARVARKHGISLRALARLNGLKTRSQLQVGQVLKVGVSRSRSVPSGYEYRKKFIWPVKGGRITSSFGRRSNPFAGFRQYHKGIDIGAPLGTPVLSAGDGLVILAGRTGGYGNCIFIRHANGFVSVYGHNKKLMVKRGDIVKQGQTVAEVGRTGSATGPHLHFEIRKFKRPIHPMGAMRMRELVPVRSSDGGNTAALFR